MSTNHVAYNHPCLFFLSFLVLFLYFSLRFMVLCLAAVCLSSRPDLFLRRRSKRAWRQERASGRRRRLEGFGLGASDTTDYVL
ncbi:hypothetical protein JB92DRAFT_879356 [Gautieria morchelliformis]|nr:hypothetical protein JB92DRAFT_879356 [Gautieria morchelliformis]